MSETLGGFCRDLLDDHEQGVRLDPESVAARFVECFGVSLRPTLDELKSLMRRAGFGEVEERDLERGMKGVHFGAPGQKYHIYCRDVLWQGSKEYTVLHEAYEIKHETMSEMHSGSKSPRKICGEADRFAAAVLMQPERFLARALDLGLDLIALQREYQHAYAAVALRLAEVVRHPPLMVVLYEHAERGDPALWPAGDDLASLRVKVIRRTAGLGPPGSRLITGRRGGIPRKHRGVPSGSLAELAARSGQPEYAEADGLAVVATPVYWKGRLAKLAVVAVPGEYRAALAPQLGRRGLRPGTRNSPRAALAAP